MAITRLPYRLICGYRLRSCEEATRVTHVVLRTVLLLTVGVVAFACGERIPRSESDVTFRHTAVTVRPAATADHSSHGSDAVRERVRSHPAGSAGGVVWECVVFR